MDKKKLNNEIVLCRAAVRKAKVAVIRKIVKKMKILKTCKVEAVKEKKLRKCERLFEKIQIMKKIKVDEVTKFALRNSDLGPFLQGPKVELRQNALACLAKHDAVKKKINSIREQIPNWESELPHLLDSLGKKNRQKLKSKKNSISISEVNKVKEKVKKVPPKEDATKSKKNSSVISKVNKIKKVRKVPPKEDATKPETVTNFGAQSEESDSSITEHPLNSSEKVGHIKKIVDPFFIGKEVAVPKLALQNLSERKTGEKISRLREAKLKRGTSSFVGSRQKTKDSGKLKAEAGRKVAEEEALHPSWAAKKVKLIKPFQGKKITFSED